MFRNILENISSYMNPDPYAARHRLRKWEWRGRIFKPQYKAAKAIYKIRRSAYAP